MKDNVEAAHVARRSTLVDLPLHWELLLYPVPFGLALILRVLQLGTFATWSELAWAFRAAKFWQALTARGFDAWSDPGGTVTLWVASAGLAFRRLLEGPSPALGWQELGSITTLNPQSLAHLRLVAPLWLAAALPVAIVNAVLLVVLAFLVARLWGARAGLFAGLLLAVTPYYLAHSRLLGPDALTAGLTVASLLALLWALRGPGSWALFILSGALAGLALLNQGMAAPVVPYALLLLIGTHLAQRRRPSQMLRNAALWGGALLAGAIVANPVIWATPLASLPHGALSMLLAQATAAWRLPAQPPGAPAAVGVVALGLRMTPLSLIALALALLRLRLDRNRHRLPLLALLAFALLFWRLAAIGEVDGHQPLTAIVALDVAAAVGLDGVARAGPGLVRSRRRRLSLALNVGLSLVAVGALGWQASRVIAYRPYYPAYRNPWLAGRALAAGWGRWGEGMDQAAAWLNTQPRASSLRVATPDVALLALFFTGETIPLTHDSLLTADFVVVYDHQAPEPDPLLAQLPATPAHVVRLHDMDYVRIYANQLHEPIVQLLTEEAHADDVVLLDAPSPFSYHYRGPARYEEIEVISATQVAARLNALGSGHWRLWHVAFDGADPDQLVRDLLESQALLLERRQVPGAIVSTYLLPLQMRFGPPIPDQHLGLHFPGGLSLERAGVAENRVQYRQKIALALQWQVGEEPLDDVALSLRLVDSQGRVWVQQDRIIADAGGRSVSAWERRAGAQTVHLLAIPPGLPPGPYQLQAVLYMAKSHQPLVPHGPAGRHRNEVFDLLGLEVLPSQLPPAVAELQMQRVLQIELADGIELLGCEVGAQARSDQDLWLRLWWRSTAPLAISYQARLVLLDARGELRGERIVELAGAHHPTTAWSQGEVIEGRYSLRVNGNTAPGEAIVGVQLLTPHGPAGEAVQIGTVQVTAIERIYEPPAMQARREETLGGAVRLLGYDLDRTRLKPGERLRLTLYWQCLAPMQTSYTVFTHLLDAEGQMSSGHDSMPANGDRPTRGWALHEVVADTHEIVVPAHAAAGRYSIEVGLYDAQTGARLPAYDAGGARLEADSIPLRTVEVVEG